MATSFHKTNVSPPLMHAFRSAHQERASRTASTAQEKDGEKVAASRRSIRSAISEPVLRKEVARDLGNLVNTVALGSAIDLGGFDAVRVSILNYGVPDLSSRYFDQVTDGRLAKDIEDAIRRYEPRLIGRTLRIRENYQLIESTLSVRFEVAADLTCDPVAVPVTFLADVEMASGKIQISRLTTR
jgi:type VI secretion system protein ImpF